MEIESYNLSSGANTSPVETLPEYQKYLSEDPFSAVDKTNYDVNFWMQKLLSAKVCETFSLKSSMIFICKFKITSDALTFKN